jgi:diacylglycerol kinase
LIGKAKDLAAAGVTIVAAGALACGALIFVPRILRLFVQS